nr:mucin-17 isoform X2 [Ipomoea batatas]
MKPPPKLESKMQLRNHADNSKALEVLELNAPLPIFLLHHLYSFLDHMWYLPTAYSCCEGVARNQTVDIAIGKENSILMDASRPMLTVVGKASPDRRDLWSRTTARRNSRSSQKVKQKLMDSESKPLPSNTDSDEKTQKPMARIVGSPSKGDSMKPPPKLESKCNCAIM